MVQKRPRSAELFCTIDSNGFGMAMLLVIIVLLFIEMICSGPHHYGSSVDLPKAYHAAAQPRASREEAMVVAITRDSKVYLESDRVEPGRLPQLIRERLNVGTENKVYLKVDRRAKQAVVDRILAEVSAANIYKIAFLVEQRHAPPPPPPVP